MVGTGIRLVTQITPEARAVIEHAERVLYLATDPVMIAWMERLNPAAESLHELYQVGRDRRVTYELMVERALAAARGGARTCFALYGHPGVLAHPAHEAIRRARREGIEARMMPGISAEDCLFADLGVDPGACGCHSFEASDFLVHRRVFDPRSALVIWQIAAIGVAAHTLDLPDRRGLRVLARRLLEFYPAAHEVVIYEASEYPGGVPGARRVAIAGLAEAPVSPATTLYVPPLETGTPDPATLAALEAGDSDRSIFSG